MKTMKLLAVVIFGILVGTIIYLQQKTEKCFPVAFVCMNTEQKNPSYLAALHTCSLSSAAPIVAQKALNNTLLHDCLQDSDLYKIVLPEDIELSNKHSCVKLSKLDHDSGFIHAAYGNQVEPIVAKFFKDASTILIVKLDKQALANQGTEVKNEQNKPNGEFFPHLHGKQQIPSQAISASFEFTKQPDGTWLVTCITLYK
jgi:uncharacterized protein (DUF952 family)